MSRSIRAVETSGFSCIGGTKTAHKKVLKVLNKIPKENKLKGKDFVVKPSKYNGTARYGKTVVVKAKKVLQEKTENVNKPVVKNPLEKLFA